MANVLELQTLSVEEVASSGTIINPTIGTGFSEFSAAGCCG